MLLADVTALALRNCGIGVSSAEGSGRRAPNRLSRQPAFWACCSCLRCGITSASSWIAARAAIQEDALVIPQRRQEQHAQKAGWRLSLFGARRPEPSAEETPIPQFRNANAVTSAKSMSSAQAVEDHEPEDDLEIPSFLRRLAN